MSNVVDLSCGTHMSITALSLEFGMARETIRTRLADAGVVPSGKRGAWPVYRLKDVLQVLIGGGDQIDPDQLDPYKRKAFYQGELEKLKLQEQRREVVPRLEMEQEVAYILKATVQFAESMPDVLERDCNLTPQQVARMEALIDALREELYGHLTDEDADSALSQRA